MVKSDSHLALLLHNSGLFQRILSAGLDSFKHCPRVRATLMHLFSPNLFYPFVKQQQRYQHHANYLYT